MNRGKTEMGSGHTRKQLSAVYGYHNWKEIPIDQKIIKCCL